MNARQGLREKVAERLDAIADPASGEGLVRAGRVTGLEGARRWRGVVHDRSAWG